MSLKQEGDPLDYIENQCRRTNILIYGIADVNVWSESKKKVTCSQSFRDLMTKNMDIERAQRIGQYQEGSKPRKILVKLLSYKDRQCILFSAKKLKGTNIFLNKDFSKVIQLSRERAAAQGRGDKASLKYDKLVIVPRGGQTQSDVQSA